MIDVIGGRYAHNGSKSTDGNGFWNDMDILEVGVGSAKTALVTYFL